MGQLTFELDKRGLRVETHDKWWIRGRMQISSVPDSLREDKAKSCGYFGGVSWDEVLEVRDRNWALA